jgi:hypothetical protein
MCYTFISLATQWFCLYCRHHQHVSNSLHYDITRQQEIFLVVLEFELRTRVLLFAQASLHSDHTVLASCHCWDERYMLPHSAID